MRRVIALCITMCLLCLLSNMAFATTVTSNEAITVNTTLVYGVENEYTVSIPESLTITGNVTPLNIAFTNVMLKYNQYLTFGIFSDSYHDGYWHLTHDSANLSIPYSLVYSGPDAEIAPSWLPIYVYGDASYGFYVALLHEPVYAGIYRDVITIEVSVETTDMCSNCFSWHPTATCIDCKICSNCAKICPQCGKCGNCVGFAATNSAKCVACTGEYYDCKECGDMHTWDMGCSICSVCGKARDITGYPCPSHACESCHFKHHTISSSVGTIEPEFTWGWKNIAGYDLFLQRSPLGYNGVLVENYDSALGYSVMLCVNPTTYEEWVLADFNNVPVSTDAPQSQNVYWMKRN